MSTTHKLAVPAGGFRRIAVIRLSSLGDVVLTLPVVHALRRAYPEADLQYWVMEEYAAVLRDDPAVTRVRALERDASRVEDLVSMSAELEDRDLIVDLHGSLRSRLLTFRLPAPVLRLRGSRVQRERWVRARWTRPRPLPHATARYAEVLAPLGLMADGAPHVTVGAAAREWARSQRSALGPGTLVALCPGARHATKCWPEERWCELERGLAQIGVQRVVLSTASERRALPKLSAQLTGTSGGVWATEPLERSMAWLGECTVAVTHDSGLMHLAAASDRPVVALFGSTSPVLGFSPCGPGHAVISRELACQPCTVHGRNACPLGHFRCMLEIGVEEVLALVRDRLSGQPGAS